MLLSVNDDEKDYKCCVVLMQSYLVSWEQVSINPLLQSGDLRLLRSQQVSTGKDFESVKE